MLEHSAIGNSNFVLANLGRSVLPHSLVERTGKFGKLRVASHSPYATDNMVPPWCWENQRTDGTSAVTPAQKCCVTHLTVWGKISPSSLHCTVSGQTVPGEMSWSGGAEMITALLIFLH